MSNTGVCPICLSPLFFTLNLGRYQGLFQIEIRINGIKVPSCECLILPVTVSPSPQSKDEENEKLHKLREYARDFRRQHTTDAEQFDWDSDDGDYGLAIGCLVVT
jgi:hypothetical protein